MTLIGFLHSAHMPEYLCVYLAVPVTRCPYGRFKLPMPIGQGSSAPTAAVLSKVLPHGHHRYSLIRYPCSSYRLSSSPRLKPSRAELSSPVARLSCLHMPSASIIIRQLGLVQGTSRVLARSSRTIYPLRLRFDCISFAYFKHSPPRHRSILPASVGMVAAQLRPGASVVARAARRIAPRSFSTGCVLQQEIRDAYILSASRTPTAKVR